MRRFTAAVLLVATALVWPKVAEALDCGWGPWQYQAADDIEASAEEQARDLEARTRLDRLERTPIIFRGRIVSARYLSDLRKTNTPSILLVFDHVEVLKGRLAPASSDRRAFVIEEEWCDGTCPSTNLQSWRRGDIVVIGARPNSFADPSKAVEHDSNRIIYRGRIDAVLGLCDFPLMTPMDLELLNAPADEIDRLKRKYPRRRFD